MRVLLHRADCWLHPGILCARHSTQIDADTQNMGGTWVVFGAFHKMADWEHIGLSQHRRVRSNLELQSAHLFATHSVKRGL